jgi:hypothetical protein
VGAGQKSHNPTQHFAGAADSLGMKNTRLRVRSPFIPFRRHRRPARIATPDSQPSTGIAVEEGGPRIVAMTLAQELASAVSAQPDERKQLIDSALSVGQWLADQGHPGRWDKVKPAEILRCLDFLPRTEQERFLFSFVGLLGHGALSGQIPPQSAKRSLEEISRLTQEGSVRAFACTTAAQLQPQLLS